MKKISLFLFIVLFSFTTFAQKQQVKVPLNAKKSSFEIVNKSSQNLVVKSSLSGLYFSEVNTKGGDYSVLQASGLIKTFDVGNPNLPVISKLIEVPQEAEVVVTIVSYDEEIINLSDHGITNQIIPAQASVSKSTDPIDVPFTVNDVAYSTDAFLNSEIAIYEDAGQMRATRLGRIEICPFQYNPVQNQLKVYNNLVVEITFVGGNYTKTQSLKQKYASPYFDNMLGSSVINFEKSTSKELVQIPHLVIVSDRMFEAQLQPYIDWKELKGFDVTVGYTDDIGSTTATIKTWLQAIYEGDNPMEFVLFVGDVQQIPAWSGSAGGHVTDLRYCEYTVGGDDVPEVYYGRFSAQNTTQLQPQIDKTLMYEQYTMSDPSYLAEVFLVAGDDESWEDIHGNGAIWYGDNYYCNSDNGIYAHTFLQDPPTGNPAVSDSILANMNDGLAFANYTAHCGSNGWGTPSFTTTDVNGLTNNEKYGLWIGNCCLSVKFDDNECFGEAALRKANGGAIGDIGGSNSTYWDEDYWWGVGLGSPVEQPDYDNFGLGAYDGVFHTLTNEVNNTAQWYVTQGQVNTCGVLAVEASSSSRKQYYWEIYHLMGDPTLMNFLGVPDVITWSFSPTIMIGVSTVDISTNAPYALIAVHQGGDRIAVASADADGNATLDFSSPIVGGDVTLVITGQNKQPVNTTLTPVSASAPYITVSSYTPEVADYNSSVNIDVVFENVASGDNNAANITATLTTTDPYVSITNGTTDVGDIDAGATASITDAFGITINNNVPDQHEAEFLITIGGDGAKYTWSSTIDITINAPELEGEFGSILDESDNIAFSSSPVTLIDTDTDYSYSVTVTTLGGNDNGLLDAGENIIVTFNATNIGHAGINNVYGNLSTTSEYIIISNPQTFVESIAVGEIFGSEFNIEVSETAPEGAMAEFEFIIASAQYKDTLEHSLPIGLVIEDFESGDLTTYNWQTAGTPDWSVTASEAHEGTYSVESGTPDAVNGVNSLSIDLDGVQADQTISFWYKTSTEDGYDDFLFKVDGAIILEANGEVPWTEYEYTFTTAGDYSISFVYKRDCCDDGGSNNVWLDYVIFPVAPAMSKDAKSISISSETTLPTWLDLQDNGDGTAMLSGTTPSTNEDVDIVLLASDGTYSSTQEFTIRVGVTSIYTINNLVKFYPNPTTDILNISLDRFVENSSVVITSIDGKVIVSQILTDQITQIDLSNFATGIYILNLEIDGQILNNKIIIE